MKRTVENLPIKIIGLNDIDGDIPVVDESGSTPLENAKIKAEAYYKSFQCPVFSCDSGLYFENIPKELQPGVYIRRINGKERTDSELINYYAKLASNDGGKLVASYRNAIYLVEDDNVHFSSMDET